MRNQNFYTTESFLDVKIAFIKLEQAFIITFILYYFDQQSHIYIKIYTFNNIISRFSS